MESFFFQTFSILNFKKKTAEKFPCKHVFFARKILKTKSVFMKIANKNRNHNKSQNM